MLGRFYVPVSCLSVSGSDDAAATPTPTPTPRVVLCRKRKRDPRTTSDVNWEGVEAFEFMEKSQGRNPHDPGTPEEGRTRTQIGPFYTYNPLPVAQKKILRHIHTKFTPDVLDEFVLMVHHDKVPLRMYEWLVTNYGKQHVVALIVKRPDGTHESVNVHEYYKNMRWTERKRHFDFFCKRFRVAFDHEGKTYVTAVTQLNIFLFARDMRLRDILLERLDEVKAHYEACMEARDTRRRRGETRRKELSGTHRDRTIVTIAPVTTRVTLRDD